MPLRGMGLESRERHEANKGNFCEICIEEIPLFTIEIFYSAQSSLYYHEEVIVQT